MRKDAAELLKDVTEAYLSYVQEAEHEGIRVGGIDLEDFGRYCTFVGEEKNLERQARMANYEIYQIEVVDDSGAVQDTFDIESAEIEKFEAQLPEGWSCNVLTTDVEGPITASLEEFESKMHHPGAEYLR